jgi:hypothetical protein
MLLQITVHQAAVLPSVACIIIVEGCTIYISMDVNTIALCVSSSAVFMISCITLIRQIPHVHLPVGLHDDSR